MSSPHHRTNDPFETLVELTAAAMRARPPRDFVYASEGPSLLQRLYGLLARLRLPHRAGEAQATGDAASGPHRQ